MTNAEYDLMDELYFIQSYQELKGKLGLSDPELSCLLLDMLGKGWVKVINRIDGEDIPDFLPQQMDSYSYLATKAGLFAHNSV